MANTTRDPGAGDRDISQAILEALQKIATRPLTLSVSPPSLEGRGSIAVSEFRAISARLKTVFEPAAPARLEN